jgi:hypothetical protein
MGQDAKAADDPETMAAKTGRIRAAMCTGPSVPHSQTGSRLSRAATRPSRRSWPALSR